MVAIHLDANYIFNEPMKNRTEGEMIKAYQKIINRMKAAGLGLKTHQLDNEASTAYKECIRHNGMIHELVPPDNHRSNLAERAIQTFKHHFISILTAWMTNSRCHCGVLSSNKQNSP
jgi:site-specific DNA-adenine methylase